MTYWLLTTEFYPFFGGGIATYCKYTAEMLAGKGFKVVIITPGDESINNRVRETTGNYTVIRFNPGHSIFSKVLGHHARLSYRFAEVVEELIAEGQLPDIIESQDYLGIAYYLQQFKLLKTGPLNNIPVIITLHSPAYLYLEANRVPVYQFPEFQVCEMERQSIAASDFIISPTQYIYEQVQKKNPLLPPERVKVIPNPFFAAADQRPSFSYKRGKIVFYGKLSVQKGTLNLLSYFTELWETTDLDLLLVGGTDIVYYPEVTTMGDYVRTRYKKYIDKGRLQILEKIRPEALEAVMSDAHIVIIPSIIDNLPYALLENMALGKVVLASVQGGQREVIEHGKNGFLFDHSIAGDFGKNLLHILSLTEKELSAISLKAAETIGELFSFDAVFARKNQTVREVLKDYRFPARFPFLWQEPYAQNGKDPATEKLLTVVIPFYNMGAYIAETISSVVNGDYKNIELIIVNDGSDDPESLQVLSLLSEKYKCRIITTSQSGVAHARNTGAAAAQGEFLAFLDADDKVAPTYYSSSVSVLEKFENVFAVGCFVKYFENKKSYWITFTPQPPYLLVHNSVNSSGLVYKRSAFLAAGLNDKLVDYGLEDYESVIHMVSKGYNMVVIPEVLFHYRVRKKSMFRGINRNKFLYSYKYIAEKHSAYFSKFTPEVISLLNANGPGYLFDNPTFERRVYSFKSIKAQFETRIAKTSYAYKLMKQVFLFFSRKAH